MIPYLRNSLKRKIPRAHDWVESVDIYHHVKKDIIRWCVKISFEFCKLELRVVKIFNHVNKFKMYCRILINTCKMLLHFLVKSALPGGIELHHNIVISIDNLIKVVFG